jgi:ectoine hydroxylase-related dioxygenase (phytanoyl-CoA dioxygenase family)
MLNLVQTEIAMADYAALGVAHLAQAIDAGWVTRLERGLQRILADPGPLSNVERSADGVITYVSDMFGWTRDPDLRSFVFESPAAKIAAAAMGVTEVRFFFDHAFMRTERSQHTTHWHNDLGYWPISGQQICTIWIPLDDVDEDCGELEYVIGSHLWGQSFKNTVFPMHRKTNIGRFDAREILLNPVPDVEQARSAFDIRQFPMKRGDCLVHHPLILHASPAQKEGRRRWAYATRWAGPDVRYAPRVDTQKLIYDPGLEHGDPLSGELFPLVYTA